ncbi:MAG: hypothetical protein IKV93_00255 [Alphaproteobacteria bacterium]|nr:hypothetical protein [Alphaproteobacteria bacterium]
MKTNANLSNPHITPHSGPRQRNLAAEIARSNIKYLKQIINTTDERGREALAPCLSPEIWVMANSSSPQEVIKKLELAIKLDKYRPRDLFIEMFAIHTDLEYVGGEFSTYNPHLAKMMRNMVAPQQILDEILMDIHTSCLQVAEQYALDWQYVIRKNQIMMMHAKKQGKTGNKDAMELFLDSITQDMLALYGIPGNLLAVKVVDSWNQVPKHMRNNLDKQAYAILTTFKGTSYAEIHIHRQRIYNNSRETDKFCRVISALAHEFGHYIDEIQPNHGALGEQKAYLGNLFDDVADYEDKPTEESSACIGEIVYRKLSQSKLR